MGVEVLCRVEVLPRVGGAHECLLVTGTPYSKMVVCAVRYIRYIRATLYNRAYIPLEVTFECQ